MDALKDIVFLASSGFTIYCSSLFKYKEVSTGKKIELSRFLVHSFLYMLLCGVYIYSPIILEPKLGIPLFLALIGAYGDFRSQAVEAINESLEDKNISYIKFILCSILANSIYTLVILYLVGTSLLPVIKKLIKIG